MRQLCLGDSLEVLLDHRGKTPKKLGADFTDDGVPVASAVMVDDGVLDLSGARFVSFATYERWMAVPTRRGDVLLTSEAPLGRVARVSSDHPLVLGQRLFGLRGRYGVLHDGYLFYALQTERVRADLIGRSTGTTVSGIRQSALRQVFIPAPSFDEQQAIAEVLGALDEKIAANQRLVQASSDLALTLAATGDAQAPLSTIASLRKETVSPTTLGDQGVHHYSLPAFDDGTIPEACAASSIKSNKLAIDGPCVLLSKLNPRIPRVWDVPSVPTGVSMASTEFLVLVADRTSSSVLWALLSQPAVWSTLQGMVAGTSGSHQRVKPADVMAVTVTDPRSLDGHVSSKISSLGRLAWARRQESLVLRATREYLLPLLMSGKVRVKDAEKIAEEVL